MALLADNLNFTITHPLQTKTVVSNTVPFEFSSPSMTHIIELPPGTR